MRCIVIILLLFAFCESYSQIRRESHVRLVPTPLEKQLRVTDVQVEKIHTLFQTIEAGIIAGNIGKFSDHFDKQIFVNITRGEHGYFSSDQAASLLQHYVGTRKVISFEFSRLNEKEPTPYATGRLVSIYKGTLESAQVYVSCTWQSSEWVIGQFNIY